MLNAGAVGVLGVLAVNPEFVRVVVVSCGARRCRFNIVCMNLPFRFAWGVDLEAFCRAHMPRRIYPISPLIFKVAFAGNRQVSDICRDPKRALPMPGGSAWSARLGTTSSLSTRLSRFRRTDEAEEMIGSRGKGEKERSQPLCSKSPLLILATQERVYRDGEGRLRQQCRQVHGWRLTDFWGVIQLPFSQKVFFR